MSFLPPPLTPHNSILSWFRGGKGGGKGSGVKCSCVAHVLLMCCSCVANGGSGVKSSVSFLPPHLTARNRALSGG